jgi:hypothetical protein
MDGSCQNGNEASGKQDREFLEQMMDHQLPKDSDKQG